MAWIIISLVGLFFVLAVGVMAISFDKDDKKEIVIEKTVTKPKVIAKPKVAKPIKEKPVKEKKEVKPVRRASPCGAHSINADVQRFVLYFSP